MVHLLRRLKSALELAKKIEAQSRRFAIVVARKEASEVL